MGAVFRIGLAATVIFAITIVIVVLSSTYKQKYMEPFGFYTSTSVGPLADQPTLGYGVKATSRLCGESCEKDARCKAYYYDRKSGTCNGYAEVKNVPQTLRAGIYGVRDNDANVCTLPWVNSNYTNFMYGSEPTNAADYTSMGLGGSGDASASIDACANLCRSSEDCKSFMYDTKSKSCKTSIVQHKGRGKVNSTLTVADKWRESVAPARPDMWTDIRYEKFNYNGSAKLMNPSLVGSSNVQDCANMCDESTTCASMSYDSTRKVCSMSIAPYSILSVAAAPTDSSIIAANKRLKFADPKYRDIVFNKYTRFGSSNLGPVITTKDVNGCATRCEELLKNCYSFMYETSKNTSNCTLSQKEYNDADGGNIFVGEVPGVNLNGNVLANKVSTPKILPQYYWDNPYPDDFENFRSNVSLNYDANDGNNKILKVENYQECMQSCHEDSWCRSMLFDDSTLSCSKFGYHIDTGSNQEWKHAPRYANGIASNTFTANKKWKPVNPNESDWFAPKNGGVLMRQTAKVPVFEYLKHTTLTECANLALNSVNEKTCKMLYHGELGCACYGATTTTDAAMTVDPKVDIYGTVLDRKIRPEVSCCVDTPTARPITQALVAQNGVKDLCGKTCTDGREWNGQWDVIKNGSSETSVCGCCSIPVLK